LRKNFPESTNSMATYAASWRTLSAATHCSFSLHGSCPRRNVCVVHLMRTCVAFKLGSRSDGCRSSRLRPRRDFRCKLSYRTHSRKADFGCVGTKVEVHQGISSDICILIAIACHSPRHEFQRAAFDWESTPWTFRSNHVYFSTHPSHPESGRGAES